MIAVFGYEAIYYGFICVDRVHAAYEVVGSIMKNLADMNQQLLDVHQQKQKLSGTEKIKEDPTKQITNNNAIFVGSTSELAKMIQNMNSGE